MLIRLFLLVLFINTSFSCVRSSKIITKGDVYIINNNSFTTWKITDINDKKVYYIPNDFNVSERKQIKSINKVSNYTDAPHNITINEFKKIDKTVLIKTQTK